jgi:hypothetical protein
MNDIDLKNLWQSSPVDADRRINIDTIRAKANVFEAKIKRRNAIEWIACTLVIALHARDALESANTLILTGNLVVVLGGLFIAMVLWRKGRVSLKADPALDSVGFIHEHANALDDQAKLLARVPSWYLSPFVIGLGFLFAGRYPAEGKSPMAWIITLAVVVMVFLSVAGLNLRAARKLRREAEFLRDEFQASRA